MSSKFVWVDCDPGHDDAIALLMAVHAPGINLVGVSTVHGNTDANNTALNAARVLHAWAAPTHIKVYPGAAKPLLREARHDPEIHGIDGLGGVQGLPSQDNPDVLSRIQRQTKAVDALADAIQRAKRIGLQSQTDCPPVFSIATCGPLTNLALFVSLYPDLVSSIDEIVFMGGGVGIGNRSAVAEFNILCDPEAAQIVLNTPVPKVMIPLNVTHTAIATDGVKRKLQLDPEIDMSPLRRCLYTVITFFEQSYRTVFGFVDGPPLHDALTIAYLCQPTMFAGRRFRVGVELNGSYTAGETVVDIYGYYICDDTWGRNGRNCLVAEKLEVGLFFDLLLGCLNKCEPLSPLSEVSQ